MKSRIVLDGLSDDMWKPEHNSKLSKFVSDTMEQLVVVYVDDQRGLTVCSYLPPHTVQQLAYFVREESAIVTADNFHKVVQFGSIPGGHVDGLLRTLHGLYAPTFFEDTTWPDSILKQKKNNLILRLSRKNIITLSLLIFKWENLFLFVLLLIKTG